VDILEILAGAWLLLIIVAVAIAITGPQSASGPGPRPGHQVVSDLAQLDMLEADQQMLQQMRSGATPNMVTMIRVDPMWVDPNMVRLQEEYQAQLDRMIGKRPRQP
jgi:hypothetical protein